MNYLIIYLLIINIIVFLIYGIDKYQAKNEQFRIPEKKIFILILLGGMIGSFWGIFCFNHKKRKYKFYLISILSLFIWLYLMIIL